MELEKSFPGNLWDKIISLWLSSSLHPAVNGTFAHGISYQWWLQ